MHLQTTLTVGAVGIAPSKPEIMYVASGEDGGDWNPSWPGTGIYRSETEGKYWDLMANSLTDFPSRRFSALLTHTNDPDIIYVAGNKGLHKSIDGGKSWIKNPGLNSLFDGRITDVVMAHDDPDRIYIGVMDSGVFRSNTGGIETSSSKAFEHLKDSNQLPWGWNAGWIKLAIGVKGKDGSNFLAAKLGPNGQHIYTSSNGGATWDQKASGVAEAPYVAWCSVIAVDPHDQDILYAGAAHELKRTTNGGTNAADWISVNNGIHPDQQDLLFDPRDPKKVYLANDGGLYFSDDRGSTWTMRSGQLAVTQCYDLDISQKQPDVIGCGGQDVGIFYKGISGKWVNIPWYDGTQIAIDPTDPNIFYFSTQTGVKFLVNGAGKSIGKSPDAGNTTQLLSKNNVSGVSPWVTILKLDPTDPIVDPLRA
jgi:hypothetical protein